MRGVFAEAVACDVTRFWNLRLHNAERRNRHGQDCRLSDLGEAKLVLWPFETNVRQLVAQCLVGLFKRLPRHRILLKQILPHANHLRSLAGKNQRNLAVGHWKDSYEIECWMRPQPS